MIPARRPATPLGPTKNPTTRGDAITKIPGAIIFTKEASVEILMHPL
jgi:hypothetical protein